MNPIAKKSFDSNKSKSGSAGVGSATTAAIFSAINIGAGVSRKSTKKDRRASAASYPSKLENKTELHSDS